MQAVNLFVLHLCFHYNGQEQCFYPVLLQQGAEMILVDCGYPGFLPLLAAAVAKHNLTLQQLTGVLITHHDNDHMGALAELKERYPQVRVYASAEEAPYISGRKKSLRLQQAEDLFPRLPDEQKEGALQFQEMLKAVRPVAVDETLAEGAIPFLPGVAVVFTPGHMPGHLSLYLEREKILVAADAVVYENGELNIANPAFTLDLPAAVESVKRLRGMDINKLVCYHGGVVDTNIAQELDNLIAKFTPSNIPV